MATNAYGRKLEELNGNLTKWKNVMKKAMEEVGEKSRGIVRGGTRKSYRNEKKQPLRNPVRLKTN